VNDVVARGEAGLQHLSGRRLVLDHEDARALTAR
jgi:hypothetical protein